MARRPLLAWGLAGGAATWVGLAAPAPARAQEPDPVALAKAFGAAWDARDLDAVVSFFAPDGVVTQPTDVTVTVEEDGGPGVQGHLIVVADVFGAGLSVIQRPAPFAVEGDAVVWRGQAHIREWARLLFDRHHRAEATGHTATVGGVAWRYRAQVDPFQTVPGVPPVEGTATATVRAGRIAVLALAGTPGSIERRTAALAALSAVATQAAGAAPVFVGPRAAGAPAPPAPPDPRVPLVVAALGAAAWALSVARGRTCRAAGAQAVPVVGE